MSKLIKSRFGGGLVVPPPATANRYLILYAYYYLKAEPVTDRLNVLISPAPSSVSAQAYPLFNSGSEGANSFSGYPVAYPPPRGQSSRDANLTNAVLGNKNFNGLLAWNSPLRFYEDGSDWSGDQYTAISLDALQLNIPSYAFPTTTTGQREPYLTMSLVASPGVAYSKLYVLCGTVQTLGGFASYEANLGLIVNDATNLTADLVNTETMGGVFVPPGYTDRTIYDATVFGEEAYYPPGLNSFVDCTDFYGDPGLRTVTLGMKSLKFNVS